MYLLRRFTSPLIYFNNIIIFIDFPIIFVFIYFFIFYFLCLHLSLCISYMSFLIVLTHELTKWEIYLDFQVL